MIRSVVGISICFVYGLLHPCTNLSTPVRSAPSLRRASKVRVASANDVDRGSPKS